MAKLTDEQRAAALALLKDVAESEHQLRYPDAFTAIVAEIGFEVVKEPHRTTVRDPVADAKAAEEKAKADAAAAAAAKAEKK